jgi:hypothetical protein
MLQKQQTQYMPELSQWGGILLLGQVDTRLTHTQDISYWRMS